jgi:GntR family phosphonate transport system transcriptional regulator
MPQNFVPYYQRVIDAIEADIASGRLKPGEQLATTNKLADHYKYSPGTVRRAVETLVERGVLRGHQGVGVFVVGDPPEE